MRRHGRILPTLIATSALLLVLKSGHVLRGADEIFLPVPPAMAEEVATDGTAAGATATPPAREPSVVNASFGNYSRSEVEILENLSRRREELEARSRDLDMREKLLVTTERRIDDKIADLKRIKERIDALVDTHDAKEEAQLKSLVKIYENMKPKDAARIFNGLEMDVLLDVAEGISERKMAPILAEMSAEAAKALTVRLMARQPLAMSESEEGPGEPARPLSADSAEAVAGS